MAFTKPQFKRADVDRAGHVLASQSATPEERDGALTVVNNWRSSHAYPLLSIRTTLRQRARSVYGGAVVAQRIKRIPAIQAKLQKNPHMKLSQMHDIGGCRAILFPSWLVEELVKVYEKADSRNPQRGMQFVKKFDYISSPKADGYRSIHLVYKYRTTSKKLAVYNGLRIEIQIRSYIQHLWATAVETVDTYTGQALKSNLGAASWQRFFALVSSAFASLEAETLVPGTPSVLLELKAELEKHKDQIDTLNRLREVTDILTFKTIYARFFLILLDSKEKKLKIESFTKEQLQKAQDRYLEVEKANKDNPHMQAVLVSVDSVAALKKAYPNFFMDTVGFMAQLNMWWASVH